MHHGLFTLPCHPHTSSSRTDTCLTIPHICKHPLARPQQSFHTSHPVLKRDSIYFIPFCNAPRFTSFTACPTLPTSPLTIPPSMPIHRVSLLLPVCPIVSECSPLLATLVTYLPTVNQLVPFQLVSSLSLLLSILFLLLLRCCLCYHHCYHHHGTIITTALTIIIVVAATDAAAVVSVAVLL